MAKKGKILGQPEDAETANLVEVHNVGFCTEPSTRGWQDDSWPIKKGDLGRPVIPISIGLLNFLEVICDLKASVNIVLRVICEHIFPYAPLLYITMRL